MVATYNDAILGAPLKIGVIPSANVSPNFAITNGTQTNDGGLLTNNGPSSANIPPAYSPQFWWIGPDGQNSAPILSQFAQDMFGSVWAGGWYDPIYSQWLTVPSPFLGNPAIGALFNDGAGNFTYKRFNPKLVTNAISYTGIYTQPPHKLYGGYANNFLYGGLDLLIVNGITMPCAINPAGTYNTEIPVTIPYGLFEGLNGAVYECGPVSDGCPGLSGAAPFWSDWVLGPVYRPLPNGGLYSTITGGTGDLLNFSDYNGQWHQTTSNSSPTYLGRLWNGFVFSGVFTQYGGCVYTEDYITFYPLYDITGQIDFSLDGHFGIQQDGIGANFFMNGFGYSYLANYVQGITPFTQAAYIIYPAFPFLRMTVPDSFFIPSVCGCNRRSNRA